MSALERWEPRTLFPDLFEWLESPFGMTRPIMGPGMRIEHFTEAGEYVIRAELPDLDPDKDVEITVSGGVLRIHAERHEEKKEDRRTEFRYGSFTRSMILPADVKIDDVKAAYDKGILTVRIPMPKAVKQETKRISIDK
ncbi:Hsp20/alpha crystallin family protein [Actinomadura barringtoniae]|uniref:Hsp20/alpha crystallin family protein n=1 Tax=Actinomadura barringtoniae TaxID=1427535 RepID=A0A939P8P3_9ACTN|nr:Hsp20/alpha crystallin family protein [Actinomadura barringtoniae]MBO2447956.1 Hsp20/alpha crystallin family protein [Actinomadura barringtoniae]